MDFSQFGRVLQLPIWRFGAQGKVITFLWNKIIKERKERKERKEGKEGKESQETFSLKEEQSNGPEKQNFCRGSEEVSHEIPPTIFTNPQGKIFR